MTYNSTSKLYEVNITPQSKGTNVTYLITAYDNTGKKGVNDNLTQYFKYQVIPEFGVLAIMLLFVCGTASLLLLKRRRTTRPSQPVLTDKAM
jgi:hypothetical protein